MADTIKTKEKMQLHHHAKPCEAEIFSRSRPARPRQNKQHGNAMIYVLIAIALFGFLTMTLSRTNNEADGQDIDDEQAALYALELMEYAASAQSVVDMLITSGSEINDLDFVNPTSAGFNTPPHYHKVFHPQGGGLNYKPELNEAIQNGGASVWAINSNTHVEWTPSTANDAILTAYFLTRQICEIINEKLTGSSTIPVTASPHADYFLDTGTTDLDATECAACDGQPALCVENDTNDNYSFYSIIAAQ